MSEQAINTRPVDGKSGARCSLKGLLRRFTRNAQCLVTEELHPLQTSFRLQASAAISLKAIQRKYLRIDAGNAWVTLGVGRMDPLMSLNGLEPQRPASGQRAGDVFLAPGTSVEVLPGQRLVIEALHAQALHFAWCSAAA